MLDICGLCRSMLSQYPGLWGLKDWQKRGTGMFVGRREPSMFILQFCQLWSPRAHDIVRACPSRAQGLPTNMLVLRFCQSLSPRSPGYCESMLLQSPEMSNKHVHSVFFASCEAPELMILRKHAPPKPRDVHQACSFCSFASCGAPEPMIL